MILKLANRLVLGPSAVEVSQPFASYGATSILVQSELIVGSFDVFLDGSDDLDNWSPVGSGALTSQTAIGTVFAGGAPGGSTFLRLRFVSTSGMSSTVVTVIAATKVG